MKNAVVPSASFAVSAQVPVDPQSAPNGTQLSTQNPPFKLAQPELPAQFSEKPRQKGVPAAPPPAREQSAALAQ